MPGRDVSMCPHSPVWCPEPSVLGFHPPSPSPVIPGLSSAFPQSPLGCSHSWPQCGTSRSQAHAMSSLIWASVPSSPSTSALSVHMCWCLVLPLRPNPNYIFSWRPPGISASFFPSFIYCSLCVPFCIYFHLVFGIIYVYVCSPLDFST